MPAPLSCVVFRCLVQCDILKSRLYCLQKDIVSVCKHGLIPKMEHARRSDARIVLYLVA